jgi:predicted transcriptional regulator
MIAIFIVSVSNNTKFTRFKNYINYLFRKDIIIINKELEMYLETPKIDEEVLSRQLAAYGFEIQQKIMTLRIFIHGISGVHLCLILVRNLSY